MTAHPSTEAELRAVTTDERVTFQMLSTATDNEITDIIKALGLDPFQGPTFRNVAMRHPDRPRNQGKMKPPL
jgi:hypothetical protein